MPSIPQSLLWISLVVLWLFVLVPMLVGKRDTVRRTSDVALATRVLNSGAAAARLLKRGGPASGHRTDPRWQPAPEERDDHEDDHGEQDTSQTSAVVVSAAAVEEPESDCLDVDAIEEGSGALPAGDSAVADEQPEPVAEDYVTGESAEVEAEVEAERGHQAIDEGQAADQYEYLEDTSGIAAAEEPPATGTRAAARRYGRDSRTAAAVGARKHIFRRRVLTAMGVVLVVSAAEAFVLAPAAWWVFGTAAAITVLYLAYLRRQTRIEQRLRRRRMQRIARSRLGVQNAYDREFEVVPSRLRRPGAVVLEVDEEDPIFEHLDYAPLARDYGWSSDLPRAAGQ
jgi:hypothetical protein